MPHLKQLFYCVILSAIIFHGCKPNGILLDPGNKAFSKQAPPVFKVLLETTKGNIILEIRRAWAPYGADRFYNLVRYGYYNRAAFFRIRTGIWAQFGIAGNPNIAQAWRRQTIPDDPPRQHNVRGTVAYAFKDPNGRTTQIFINLRDNRSTLDSEPFVPFANVISGMEVADSLYSAYGEQSGGGIRAGRQDSVFAGGNHYLEKNFPKLDYIRKATILKE